MSTDNKQFTASDRKIAALEAELERLRQRLQALKAGRYYHTYGGGSGGYTVYKHGTLAAVRRASLDLSAELVKLRRADWNQS